LRGRRAGGARASNPSISIATTLLLPRNSNCKSTRSNDIPIGVRDVRQGAHPPCRRLRRRGAVRSAAARASTRCSRHAAGALVGHGRRRSNRASLIRGAGPWLPLRIEEDWDTTAASPAAAVALCFVDEWVCEVRRHDAHLSGTQNAAVLRDAPPAHRPSWATARPRAHHGRRAGDAALRRAALSPGAAMWSEAGLRRPNRSRCSHRRATRRHASRPACSFAPTRRWPDSCGFLCARCGRDGSSGTVESTDGGDDDDHRWTMGVDDGTLSRRARPASWRNNTRL